jgi:hypothetical protein
MNCPHCDTPNDPSSKFCAGCGRPLHGQAVSPSIAVNDPAFSSRSMLGIQTIRFLLSLLGLWLLKGILTGLPFVEELCIPEVDMSTPAIISLLIYLVIMFVLVNYATVLSRLWPQAFPGYPNLASVGVAVVYLIVLAVAYNGSKPIFRTITTDTQLLMIWQIVLAVIALLISIWVSAIVYRSLPAWLMAFRRSLLAIPTVPLSRGEGQESS